MPGGYFGPPSSCIAADRSVHEQGETNVSTNTVHIHSSFRENGTRGWLADYIFPAFLANVRRQSHLSASNELSTLFLPLLRENFFNIFPSILILILIEGKAFFRTNGPRFKWYNVRKNAILQPHGCRHHESLPPPKRPRSTPVHLIISVHFTQTYKMSLF
jgi:hypothetical protein